MSSDDGEVIKTPKKQNKAERLLSTLEEVPSSTHWSEHVFVASLGEPARGLLGKEPLVVFHFYTNGTYRIPETDYDVKSIGSVGEFIRRELGLGIVGLMQMANQAKGGGKYLVCLTPSALDKIAGLNHGLVKLSHGMGFMIYRLPVVPRTTLNMTVSKYPPWMPMEELQKTLMGLDWVEGLSRIERVAAGNGKVATDRVNMLVAIRRVAIVNTGLIASSLLENADWTVEQECAGWPILLHRTASCHFCGGDDHIMMSCESLQRLTSDSMPTYKMEQAQPEASAVASTSTPAEAVKAVKAAKPSSSKKAGKKTKGKKK
jgi:hypothetical protein